MIRALELKRSFAKVNALDGVTFEALPGEVLGFLGPNGAGKTTALRIITGYLPATSGRVEVCGIDVEREPIAARRKIGYLPESVPLYPEMRVEEYLAYRAALKEIPRRDRAQRIGEALEEAGVRPERRRIIGKLSKGYRQRVGLADALLARPEVLILDEPTDGLDPNQRREVLDGIARLGRDRTVILSTHVLPEVESICQRVVILDRGRVIAAGRPSELSRSERRLIVVACGQRAALECALRAIEGLSSVTCDQGAAEGEWQFTLEATRDLREEVARAVVGAGSLRELRPAVSGLDAVFARLTGVRSNAEPSPLGEPAGSSTKESA